MHLPRRTLLPLLLAALAVLGLTSIAEAKPSYRLGMGDQQGSMFTNPAFQKLKLKRVRYIVPYDYASEPGQAAEVAGYMAAAKTADADVLVSFTAPRGCYSNGRYSRSSKCKAPSASKYRKAFRAFRKDYPEVKTYSPWNEANHVSQPTYKHPKLAVRYYNVVRKECGSKCKIVALDLLDSTQGASYLRSFLRYAKGKPRVFGLHNYSDVNRKRTVRTREILRTLNRTRGELWLTETGGLVTFLPSFKYSPSRAASRTKDMFKLADRYDSRTKSYRARVSRLYPYQFTGVDRGERFDAGLIDPDGKPRKAYDVFARYAKNRLK